MTRSAGMRAAVARCCGHRERCAFAWKRTFLCRRTPATWGGRYPVDVPTSADDA